MRPLPERVVQRRLGFGVQGPGSSIRAVLAACFVVASACERPYDDGLPAGVPFVERDSAGVLVATTSGARARAPIGWVVDSVPEYQIGEVSGEEPYLFSAVQGTRQFSDRRVVVLDRASCELRFFGADGVFLERTGGTGQGPGEFDIGTTRRCYLVPSPGNDLLPGFDGARLSFFDDRGRFSHRFPISWRDRRVTRVRGVVGETVLVENRLFTTSQQEGVPSEPSTAEFALLELESGRTVWDGLFQGRQDYTVLVPGNSYGHVIYFIPFDILPDAALGKDGLYLTLGEERGPEILEYDTSGRLRRVIRLAEPAVAPSSADLDEYTEFQIDRRNEPDYYRETSFDRDRPRYERMPLPKFIPVFSSLMIDEVGWLWAELYRFDVRQPVRWLVFGPNGEGLGSVDMPPDLDVRQIGPDFVLGVWEDEHEVQYVRRHALNGRR